jgi:glyoxylase-like metal-dependent hydrolase (beta-lactamase superfamily II)
MAERRVGSNAPLLAGVPVTLLPGVVRILAPNPSLMTGPGTNTYLIGGEDLVAIDPGPDDDAHLDRVAAAASGRLRYIVVTHTHADHAPGARGLAVRTGATVLGYGARNGFAPDAELREGDVVAGADVTLRALHTPGHASDHLCYLLEQVGDARAAASSAGFGAGSTVAASPGAGVLFSGDHVMGGSTVVIAPPDGNMAAYLASLTRLQGLDPPLIGIAPGHGGYLGDPRTVIDGYLSHRAAREASVLAALDDGMEMTIDELVEEIYRDVAAELHPVARYSVWAHLEKLLAEGRVVNDAAGGTPGALSARWRRSGADGGATLR